MRVRVLSGIPRTRMNTTTNHCQTSYSVIMSGQPYNIILAGKYGVGKSTLFNYLSRQQGRKSVRSWDKWEHVMTVGEDQVQAVLWDTANMEKDRILSMSQSYFTQCVGVILVYNKAELATLFSLKDWMHRAQDSEWSSSLVFSLWSNERDVEADDVTPEHLKQCTASWKIPADLMFSVNGLDGSNVSESYQRVVAAVHQKWESVRAARCASPLLPAQDTVRASRNIVLPAGGSSPDTAIQQPDKQPTTRRVCCRK